MTFSTKLAASIFAFAANTASAQSLPFESTYTYGGLSYTNTQTSGLIIDTVSASGGQQYMFGDTLLFGDVSFSSMSASNRPSIPVRNTNLSFGVAQNFGDAQVGVEYAENAFSSRRTTRTTRLARAFASYETDQYGAMFTAQTILDSDFTTGTVGGHIQLNDQFKVMAQGVWFEERGIQFAQAALEYESGPWDAAFFYFFVPDDPEFNQPGIRIEYDITPDIGVGLRYVADAGDIGFAELSGRYDINDDMSVLAAFNKEFSSGGFDERESVSIALVYETGSNGRYDRRLSTELSENFSAFGDLKRTSGFLR